MGVATCHRCSRLWLSSIGFLLLPSGRLRFRFSTSGCSRTWGSRASPGKPAEASVRRRRTDDFVNRPQQGAVNATDTGKVSPLPNQIKDEYEQVDVGAACKP